MSRAQDLDVLHRAGIDDVDVLIRAAAQFVREHLPSRHAASPPLSAHERRLLRDAGAVGLDGDEPEPALQAGPADVVGQYARLVAGARSAVETASRLGVAASRVGQRVTERSLYAIDGPDGPVFPAFQFGPSGTLPGLGRVLAAIDSSVHPITVERFFLTPTVDLESDVAGGPLSPRDWLLTALPVDDVVLLARGP